MFRMRSTRLLAVAAGLGLLSVVQAPQALARHRPTDVAVTKTADKTSVHPGDTITYTITVTNLTTFDPILGPANTQDMTLTDVIPTGTRFVSWQGGGVENGSNFDCATPAPGATKGQVTCSGFLGSGGTEAGSETFTMVVQVKRNFDGRAVTNTARVIKDEDPDLSNNTATVKTKVVQS